ncbi:glutathione s transferase d10 isoform a-related [Holotrichia oblita]|uniref:Glutathione s transferase d10 isoform a-related n=2 Tax=Holotrichia oblita TaxID=644536 RepID=A0ACB9SZW7_HOLOL|nr:glutathione s transferase d10 isoform a-related [Holotrichia oblita]KAI4460150.1 glutathione s transferase d10 isoform a-related [Holotrichia oblita]
MDLYVTPISPACNAVLLLAKALKLNLNVKLVDLMAGDTKTPEFLKMNPQHSVPTLNDSGFCLWESRAIMTYLVNKYGSRDDPLYPKDPKPKAVVESRLFFDATTLYPAFAKCYYPVLFYGQNKINEKDLEDAKNVFEIFDTFLEHTEYAGGDTFSVADITLIVTVTVFQLCHFDVHAYKRISLCKMGIDLYYVPGSAPCRAVLLAAKAVGVDLNLKYTDLMKGEHLTPEYIKMNPQHTIPTINDNGFCLWESRAIMAYLADQYGKNDKIYPKDPKKRALVDQRLYFDIGTLYARFGDYYYPVIFAGASYDPAKLTKCEEAMKFFDTFLANSEYAAGNDLTLADLTLAATVSTYEVMDFDLTPYKNVTKWFAKVKQNAPGYEEVNGKNVLIFKQLVDSLTKK